MALTQKQQRFCDEYLIDLNATRAYMVAYPSTKKETVAASNGSRMLRNDKVHAYLEKRLEEIQSQKIADQTEVMEYLTSVMRREKSEFVVVTLMKEESTWEPDEAGVPRKHTVKKEVPQIVEIPARLSDANKAAELLGKRYALFTAPDEGNKTIEVVFAGAGQECWNE